MLTKSAFDTFSSRISSEKPQKNMNTLNRNASTHQTCVQILRIWKFFPFKNKFEFESRQSYLIFLAE